MREKQGSIWFAAPFCAATAGLVAALANLAAETALAPGLVSMTARAHLALVCIFVLLAAVPAVVGVVVAAATGGLARLGLERVARFPGLITALLAVAPLYMVGAKLASGAWVSQQSWASAFPIAVAAGGALGAALLTFVARSQWKPRIISALFVLAGLVLVGADVYFLPGLYPFIHFGLRVAVAACFGIALMRTVPSIAAFRSPKALAALLLFVVAGAVWGTMSMSTRVQLLLRGGAATDFVEHLHVAPEATHLAGELNRLEQQQTPLSDEREKIAGKVQNVLFVFVDTLRADALPPTRKPGGYAKESDTPFLNGFLQGCYRFDEAYAQSSATHRSIPATFRSIETWEYSSRNGTSLGTALAQNGFHTTAVVNNYFFEPRFSSSQGLLEGFDNVKIYDSYNQKKLLTLADETFKELGDQRFFAWVHFFAMHHPGYHEKLLSKSMSPPDRYRKSLQWLDKAMKRLVGDLKKHGHLEDTAIVIASDHGEGLGANNISTHGPTIFEEEIRVPLAICLPQKAGYAKPRVVESTVSNIDIVPTLWEMLGMPADAAHRGRSLAGLFASDDATLAPHPVYFENSDKKRVGVALDGGKFIFHPKEEVFFRFDVDKDPEEETNLFRDEAADAALRHYMFRLNPTLLREEAKDSANLGVLLAHLEEIDPDRPVEEDELVLALGAFAEHEDADKLAAKAFRETKSDRLAFWILRFFRDRDIAGKLARERINRVAGTKEEAAFVELAASAGVKEFDEKWVVSHIQKLPEDDALWGAWLHLVGRWTKTAKIWQPLYVKMLETVKSKPAAISTGTVYRLLEAISSTRWRGPGAKLRGLVREYLGDERPLVQRAAIDAVGALRDPRGYAPIRAIAHDKEAGRRLRQGAIYAMEKIGGKTVARDIEVAAKSDIFLALDAFNALARLGEPDAILAIGKVHRRYSKNARSAAKRAQKVADKKK